MTKAGGEGRLERQQRAALFGDTRNSDGVSEAICCLDRVGHAGLGSNIKLNKRMRQAIGVNGIIEALGRKSIEAFLLVTTEGIERNLLSRCPGFELCKERCEVPTLDTLLCGNLPGWQDRMSSEVRDETAVEPDKWSAEQEIAAADAAIVGKLKARAMLEDSRDGGRFDCFREVRVQDFVIEESQDQCKCGVGECLDKPLLPLVRARRRAGLPRSQDEAQGVKGEGLWPREWVREDAVMNGSDRGGG